MIGKKETQDWYCLEFKDFTDAMLNLELGIKNKRLEHDEEISNQLEKKNKEQRTKN